MKKHTQTKNLVSDIGAVKVINDTPAEKKIDEKT